MNRLKGAPKAFPMRDLVEEIAESNSLVLVFARHDLTRWNVAVKKNRKTLGYFILDNRGWECGSLVSYLRGVADAFAFVEEEEEEGGE